MNNKLEEAKQFFQDYPVYKRLFSQFKQKYKSLGKIGGTIPNSHFSDDELEQIASFFGITGTELVAKGKISLRAFEQQLGRTKFEGISLHQLLEYFFGEEITTNQEMKSQKRLFLQQTFVNLRSKYPSLSFWLEYLEDKSSDTYWIYRLIEEENDKFIDYFATLHRAIEELPKVGERMPIFSQRLTKNPHALDQSSELGKLWLHLLSVKEANGEQEVKVPTDSEGINQLLEKNMLFRDDITNFATAVNFLAETEGGVHPVWAAAASMETPSVLNVPLREITSLSRVYVPRKYYERKIWVVENSGVFSTILDSFPNVPMICTHGQYRLATLKLLDLLVREGYLLMYAGDFDPEGIMMLQRLMKRYEGHVQPWRMDVEDYLASSPSIPLAENRFTQLNNITIAELGPLKRELLLVKKAGYQEAILPMYFEDLYKHPEHP